MKKYIFPLVAVLGFAACTPENENPMGDGNDEIKLQMTQLNIETRAPYMAQEPSAQAPLLARVLCSQTQGNYKVEVDEANNNGFMNFTAASTETSFCLKDGTITPKTFPRGVDSVYLVGLYPAETWTKNADTSASFNFDGSNDIMFAPEATTVKGDVVGTLAFGHKMTKINIQLRAVDDASIAPWGKIENIALTGVGAAAAQPNTTVEVAFADGDATFSNAAASLACYGTNGTEYTDKAYAGTTALTTTPTTVAYTICQPVDATDGATDEYTLTVTSSTKGDVPVSFSLTSNRDDEFTGNTAGYAFTVTLSFSAVEIQAQATVTPWDEQGTTDVTVE